jgi:hypothetical protein
MRWEGYGNCQSNGFMVSREKGKGKREKVKGKK